MSEPVPEGTATWSQDAAPDEVIEDPRSDAAPDPAADDQVVDMAAMKKLRRENASLRKAKQEAEARNAAYEHEAVERAASTVLIDPEDIYRYTDEETRAQFNDEFGAITADKVVETAKALAAERPHLGKPPTARPPSDRPVEGLRAGASPEPEKPAATSWASALRR